ncbi:hypothetical protein [Candidatus Poriferisodalis sp.]|uniref:hypothetical protein n=1 Tax=Candidatus Poriferisodalis sp. TaxID=3101277 RepID=UPI003D0A8B68
MAGILLNNEQFEGFLWMWFAANLVAYSLPWGLGVTVVPLTNVVIVVAYTLMYVDVAEVGADPPAPNDRWTRWQQWQSGQTAPP